MSHVETNGVSTARSDQMEEYEAMLDVQQRLDGMQFGEEDDGEESLVEMTALDEETGAELSISLISTGYNVSVTGGYSSMENLTDDLMSFYSDHEESEIEVECPSHFLVSSVGQAVAMDSIEALDKLADFTPIPVDFTTNPPADSLALPIIEQLQSAAESTAHAGDTDSTSTCPYQDYRKDAAITEPVEVSDKADVTSYRLAPSQTDVSVVAVDEGLVENDDYSTTHVESTERLVEMTDGAKSPVAADITVYSAPKSECDVEMSEVLLTEDFSLYSMGPSERCIEMLDTLSTYSEGPSEIEAGL